MLVSLSQHESGRASASQRQMLQPHLHAKHGRRTPLVNDEFDAPSTFFAEVQHFALSRQWCIRWKESRRTPTHRKELLLVVRDAEVNLDFGFVPCVHAKSFAAHVRPFNHNDQLPLL